MVATKKGKAPVQLDLFGHPLEPLKPQVEQAESADMFEGHEIRRIEKDGRRWWVLADVCKVIGITQATRVTDRLNEDESTVISIHSARNAHSLTVVNEAGLYHVVLTTRLRKDNPAYDKVNRFRRWVCHEVLPEIRKTGKYTGKKPLDKVAAIQKKLNCDRPTADARLRSIGQSKASHRLLARHNAKPQDYREYNNRVYMAMFGREAKGLREVLGQRPGETPMDRMSRLTLSQLEHAKALADKVAEIKNVKSLDERNEIIEGCVVYVRDNDLLRFGRPGEFVHGIIEDDSRGRIIDVVQRQLPA